MLFPGLPELGWEDHYYVCEGDPNGDFKRWAGKGKGLPMDGISNIRLDLSLCFYYLYSNKGASYEPDYRLSNLPRPTILYRSFRANPLAYGWFLSFLQK